MQRVEPRELVAAAAAALAPAAWAVAGGGHVLDHDRGAAFVVSARVVASWLDGSGAAGLAAGEAYAPAAPLPALLAAASGAPLAASGALLLGAWWACGYGGWRAARVAGAGPGAAALIAAATQLGPWSTLPLVQGDVAGLSVGVALLACAHPAWAPLLGWWGPAVGLVAAASAALRRRWVGLLALAPLLVAVAGRAAVVTPGAWAVRAAALEPSAPSYAADGGAWFPLPPPEAKPWRAAAAAYGGRWVHPLSVAVSGDPGRSLPTTALPLAVAAAVVPAAPAPLDPSARLGAAGGPALRLLAQGAGAAALLAPLAGALLLVGARRPRLAAVLALASAAAGAAALRAATPGGGPARLTGAELAAAPPAEAVFPSPDGPWLAGRWSATQLAALGRASAPEAADPALTELARLAGYGLDTRGAERATAAGRRPLAEAVAALPGGVLVDRDALPGWGWARIVTEAEAGGLVVDGEGALVVLRAP